MAQVCGLMAGWKCWRMRPYIRYAVLVEFSSDDDTVTESCLIFNDDIESAIMNRKKTVS